MKLVAEMNDHPKGKIEVLEDAAENYCVYANGKNVTQFVDSLGATPEQLLLIAAEMWDENRF